MRTAVFPKGSRMRLKTKLVLAATGTTFVIVLVLSVLFLGELLRQRVSQTAATNDVMVHQVLRMTRQAVESGLEEHPPADSSDAALHTAVADALRGYDALNDTMSSLVRYSPAVQDVLVTDPDGLTLVGTDPTTWDRRAPTRTSFDRVSDGTVWYQWREVFGIPHVLDVQQSLKRNGQPFLIVHLGIRSTFLKHNYEPWLLDAFFFALVAGAVCMLAAGLLAGLALRPLEEIGTRLASLTAPDGEDGGSILEDSRTDTVVRVSASIERLGQQMRTAEAGYTGLQASVNQMLDRLRDGVVLLTAESRVAMVSDAVRNFIGERPERASRAGRTATDAAATSTQASPAQFSAQMLGRSLKDLFGTGSELGEAVLAAHALGRGVRGERVPLDDGREVEFSLDRIRDGTTLLTLRDTGSAMRLEQELEVSRRLAAVGRLTAGVGHEVKNPINAMVVHLELLRSKLEAAGSGRSFLEGAQRHVNILAGEMERLDRVVQTLADFTRPMELLLNDVELSEVVESVVELTGAEMLEHHVEVRCDLDPDVMVHADAELLRQALLNLMLNAMQAMETEGGLLQISVRQRGGRAILQVADEGQGIAPELMPRIFELYFTTKAKGSGIGLAMTYRIVQMHGGFMEARSDPGAGACFTMGLPLAAVARTRKQKQSSGLDQIEDLRASA